MSWPLTRRRPALLLTLSALLALLSTACVPQPPPATPLKVADGFYRAVYAQDLNAARALFRVGNQPTSWADMFRSQQRIRAEFGQDGDISVQRCRTVNYSPVEKDEAGRHLVTMRFEQDCIDGWILADRSEVGGFVQPEQRQQRELIVPLEQVDGRWYITRCINIEQAQTCLTTR